MRFSAASVGVVILLLAAGCQNKGPTDKELAQKRWNDTRAAILAGVAQDQYKAHDFDKCRDTLNKALAMAPDNPQLHTLAAKLEIEQYALFDYVVLNEALNHAFDELRSIVVAERARRQRRAPLAESLLRKGTLE